VIREVRQAAYDGHLTHGGRATTMRTGVPRTGRVCDIHPVTSWQLATATVIID